MSGKRTTVRKLAKIGDVLLGVGAIGLLSVTIWAWATPWLHG